MTCKFTVTPDGARIIICTRNSPGPSELEELKKAMVCKRWEICEKCDSYETCQRVLAKRKGVTDEAIPKP